MTQYITHRVLNWNPLCTIALFSVMSRHSKASIRASGIRFLRSGLAGACLGWLFNEDHSVHPIGGSFLWASWKELLAFDCTRNYVTNNGIFFRQVRSEVHFLPITVWGSVAKRDWVFELTICIFFWCRVLEIQNRIQSCCLLQSRAFHL